MGSVLDAWLHTGKGKPAAAHPEPPTALNRRWSMSKSRYESTQADRDNRADQLNPNNDAYWQSRGEDERPEDWEERIEQERFDSPAQ